MSNRGKLVMQWVLILLIACQFLYASTILLMDFDVELFSLGYPNDLTFFVGILLATTVLGLFTSRLRRMAVLTEIFILLGSVYFHFLAGQHFFILINVGTIGLCTIVIWLEQERSISSTIY